MLTNGGVTIRFGVGLFARSVWLRSAWTSQNFSESFVLYEYKCHCDSRYVGRTSQRLQDRIKQHVPQWLRQLLTRPRRSQPHRSCKRTDTKPDCNSAIGQHLLDNDRCALNYDDKRFSILAAARSSFHLNLLEQWFITFFLLLPPKCFDGYQLPLFRKTSPNIACNPK